MGKQIIVLGLGRFGMSLAKTLSSVGHEVLAMDLDRKNVQAVAPLVAHAVEADVTDETVLQDVGASNFDIGIVAIGGDIKSSILATILLKRLKVPYVISRASDEIHCNILEKVGADVTIMLEQQAGIRLAQSVTLLHVTDYMDVLPEYGISKIKPTASMVGKNMSELGFGAKGEKNVEMLMIQRAKEIITNPGAKEKVLDEDYLFVIARHDDLEKLLTSAEKQDDTTDSKSE